MNKPLPSLKALAESKDETGVTKLIIFTVDPRKIEFEPGFNLRDEGPELDEHLERMYVAMKSGAIFPPIEVSVVEGKIIARAGHCRVRTAKRIWSEGGEQMLAARQFRGNDVDSVYHMLGENSGKGFTPLEQGRGFLRLLNQGQTIVQIAARSGLSRTSIDNGIALAEAPSDVQAHIVSGKVSATAVRAAVRKGRAALEDLKEKVAAVAINGKVKPKDLAPIDAPIRLKMSREHTCLIRDSVLRDCIRNRLDGNESEALGAALAIIETALEK